MKDETDQRNCQHLLELRTFFYCLAVETDDSK